MRVVVARRISPQAYVAGTPDYVQHYRQGTSCISVIVRVYCTAIFRHHGERILLQGHITALVVVQNLCHKTFCSPL